MNVLPRLLVASVSAVSVFCLFVLWTGESPLRSTFLLITGGGSLFGLKEALAKSIPIMLCALAASVPGRIGLMNIGAEGQMLVGGVGATGAALLTLDTPSWIALPCMIFAAVLAGAAWGLLPGVFRAFANADETVVALLLNYIAALLLLHLIHGDWKDPSGMGWPESVKFGESQQLKGLWGTRVHVTLFVAILIAVLLDWISKHTTWGFSTRVIGASIPASRHAGINVRGYVVCCFIIGGLLAGIAGFGEVAAIHGRLREGMSLNYGYAGFFVAWLCRHNFLMCIPAAFLFALAFTGADALQINTDLPFASVYVFQGLFFLAMLVVTAPKEPVVEVTQ